MSANTANEDHEDAEREFSLTAGDVDKEWMNNVDTIKALQSAQIDDLKANNSNVEELTKQIDKLKSDNEKAANQLNAQKLDFAVTSTIKDFGAKNTKAVKALLNSDDIRFDSKGNLTGLENQLKSLKDSDSYLFVGDQPTGKPIQAFPTGNPVSGIPPEAQGLWW